MTAALITGSSGFIGRRVVAALRRDHPELTLIGLDARPAPAGGDPATAPDELVVGDIGDPQLGLDPETMARLAAEVGVVFHLAAIYDLSVPDALARRVNVDGTRHVLDFCARAQTLQRLAYVSTAYVAGDRHGTVLESDLDAGQGFKNHYEHTKYEAEVEVRRRMGTVPTTILRPAIVVGDSHTGETDKFDGPYYLLRLVDRMRKLHLPTMRIGRSDAPFNVVPVDFVVAAIAQTPFVAAAEGQTLHLVDPEPITSGQLLDLLSVARTGRHPVGRVPAEAITASLRSATVRRLFGGTPRESIVYLNHQVRFDTTATQEVLGPLGLTPPPFRDYVDAVVGYYGAHA